MRKILLAFLLVFMVTMGVKAQSPGMAVPQQSKDFLILGLSYDSWLNTPDSINTGLSHGLHLAFTYDFPLKPGSKFSVAPGIGINGSHMKLKDRIADIGTHEQILNFRPNEDEYKTFKLITTYLEVPVELRYRSVAENANTGFKAALGLKLGTLLNVHTKGKQKQNGFKQTDKVSNKQYFEQWRIAGMARVGYGHFGVFATYSLTSLLDNRAGAKMNPLSIGLAITGF